MTKTAKLRVMRNKNRRWMRWYQSRMRRSLQKMVEFKFPAPAPRDMGRMIDDFRIQWLRQLETIKGVPVIPFVESHKTIVLDFEILPVKSMAVDFGEYMDCIRDRVISAYGLKKEDLEGK